MERLATRPGNVDGAPRNFGPGPLGDLARRMLGERELELPSRLGVEDFTELAEAAREAERYEDALLIHFEAFASTGVWMSDGVSALSEDPGARESTNSVMKAILESDPKRAMELLDAIDRASRGHTRSTCTARTPC